MGIGFFGTGGGWCYLLERERPAEDKKQAGQEVIATLAREEESLKSHRRGGVNMETILVDIFWIVLVLFIMVFTCFFTSGIANIPGSIFEKKSTPEERAAKAAERGNVRGGRKQAV
jgi:hypothetical protein